MIEKLLREEAICKDAGYCEISQHIVGKLDRLKPFMQEEGMPILEDLCACYANREEIVKQLAYREGFRVSVNMIEDIKGLFSEKDVTSCLE